MRLEAAFLIFCMCVCVYIYIYTAAELLLWILVFGALYLGSSLNLGPFQCPFTRVLYYTCDLKGGPNLENYPPTVDVSRIS